MTIPQHDLSKILHKLKAAMPPERIEGLPGILIHGNTATASNYNFTVSAVLPAETETPFILPDKAIAMILALPDCNMDIHVESGSVSISSKGTKSVFATVDPSKFSPPAHPENSEAYRIDAETFIQSAGCVRHAAAADESRGIHTGILFDARDGMLNAVALDGHRLAWAAVEHEGSFRFVIPKDSLGRLIGLTPSGEISIRHDERRAVFSAETFTVHTRLLEGEFFNYRRSWPEHPNHINVNRHAMLRMAERVLILQDGKKPNALAVVIKDGAMTMEFAGGAGRHAETLDIDGTGNLRIGFNPAYLRDALKAHGGDTVTLGFSEPLHPLTITSGNLRSLVLPARLGEVS